MAIKSEFQDILPDDCKQYNDVFRRYLDLNSENVEEAYSLMKDSLMLAQRWSEIQATARKIHNASNKEFTITAFKDWAYQRYRQMQLIHESTRIIWRSCNEYLMWTRKNTDSR